MAPLNAPKKLHLYSPTKNANLGCIYYRIEVPFRTAEDIGAALTKIDTFDNITGDLRDHWASESDVHVYWLLIGDSIVTHFERMRDNEPAFDRQRRRFIMPPRAVFDADDNVEYVDQFNPRFSTLGTRRPNDEELLEPGDQICIEMDGETLKMWADGKQDSMGNIFDVQDNLDRLETFKKIPPLAAGVTVSTEPLAEVYRGYGCENVYVFPNSIRFDDYPKINLRRNSKRIGILYQGGWSHYRDIEPLPEILGRVSEKYPEAYFIFWGQKFAWMASQISPTRREHLHWVPYNAYKLRLSTIDFDINLAPLVDRIFNLSKSAIKFYEPAALKRPVCTLAANVGPYKEIIDGQTGLTYDTLEEFEEKLCTLIENVKLRRELASNAKDWLKDNRDAFVTVPPLIEWYRELKYE